MIALALYQPDIPQNAGNILRLGACLGVPVHLIGPAGFDTSDRALRRSAMDYLGHAEILRHVGWKAFEVERRKAGQRLVLLTTRADVPLSRLRLPRRRHLAPRPGKCRGPG